MLAVTTRSAYLSLQFPKVSQSAPQLGLDLPWLYLEEGVVLSLLL